MSNHLHPNRHVFVASMLTAAVLAGCNSDDEATSNDTSTSDTTAAPITAAPATTTSEPATTDPPATTVPPATTAPVTTPPATAGPATTAPATTDTVEEWSMDAVGPGTFRTALMEPGFTLTYGEGWVPYQPESRNQLNIEIPESADLGCAPCALLAVNAAAAESPEAVIEFAISNGIEFADPVPIDVGGVEAQRYEVIDGAGYLFETEMGAQFGVDSTEGPARLVLLEVEDRVIAIVDLAMPDVADRVHPLTDEVIDSIEWSTV